MSPKRLGVMVKQLRQFTRLPLKGVRTLSGETLTAGSRMDSGPNGGAQALQAVAPLAPRLLDLPSAAAYMAVSPWTIRQWEAEGALPRVRISLPITNKRRGGECRKLLFDRADLDQLIERSKESAP